MGVTCHIVVISDLDQEPKPLCQGWPELYSNDEKEVLHSLMDVLGIWPGCTHPDLEPAQKMMKELRKHTDRGMSIRFGECPRQCAGECPF